MKLTIVIPSYNIVKLGINPINKVKEFISDYKNIEVIYVNDGSTDDTEKFIKDNFKDDRVRVISQDNTGVAITRKNGVAAASENTTHILFLDADDNISGVFNDVLGTKEEENTIFALLPIINHKNKIQVFKEINNRINSLFERFIFRNAIHGYIFPKRILEQGLTSEKFIFEDVLYILWAKQVDERFPEIKIKTTSIKSIVNVQEDSLSKSSDKNSKGFQKRVDDLKIAWTLMWKQMNENQWANKQLRYLFMTKYISEYFHISNVINRNIIKESFIIFNKPSFNSNIKVKETFKHKIFVILLKLRCYFSLGIIIKKTMD